MKLRKEMKEKEEEMGNAKRRNNHLSFFLFFQFHPYILFLFFEFDIILA